MTGTGGSVGVNVGDSGSRGLAFHSRNAKKASCFGSKRSQVRILSPRPSQLIDFSSYHTLKGALKGAFKSAHICNRMNRKEAACGGMNGVRNQSVSRPFFERDPFGCRRFSSNYLKNSHQKQSAASIRVLRGTQ